MTAIITSLVSRIRSWGANKCPDAAFSINKVDESKVICSLLIPTPEWEENAILEIAITFADNYYIVYYRFKGRAFKATASTRNEALTLADKAYKSCFSF